MHYLILQTGELALILLKRIIIWGCTGLYRKTTDAEEVILALNLNRRFFSQENLRSSIYNRRWISDGVNFFQAYPEQSTRR